MYNLYISSVKLILQICNMISEHHITMIKFTTVHVSESSPNGWSYCQNVPDGT